ncbi:hypothetical protein POJ06DRAFT_62819 [Lipomyces tetrasporus]|uniref:Uncharacterized protein n=1 Tax=Lipomyces tetrasporus TaxID=54092 RepID=A0AAD7QY22_9ASCO|nr:uncharacterized protein POJ06DRAFT_62819 [Lipomyces tetrasporus]KAJ8103101.1 hypothetical protein POJ06DRAFT_62819 [Lipomyces tetrasporus]
MDANYNRALNLLKSNPPEGRLDIQLSHAKYLQLEKAFFKLYPESLELRYPSLSYDSFTETVTVVTCPGDIHESAALGLLGPIFEDATQYLSSYSEDLASTIRYYGSTTTRDFEGEFEGSRKQPDGGVRYKYLDGNKVTVVLEAGFSEDYDSLCRSKDMWIDGHGVNVFILLCLTEKPRFKNPTTEYRDIGDVDAAITLMSNCINETFGLNLANNRHAPLLYRGHKWAGELKDVFIEIWRAGTSISSKYYLVQDGHTCDDLPTTLGIKISDLFPANSWSAAHIPDKVIPFNATLYVKRLMGTMCSTAEDRFKTFIKERGGRRRRRGEGGGRGGRGRGRGRARGRG